MNPSESPGGIAVYAVDMERAGRYYRTLVAFCGEAPLGLWTHWGAVGSDGRRRRGTVRQLGANRWVGSLDAKGAELLRRRQRRGWVVTTPLERVPADPALLERMGLTSLATTAGHAARGGPHPLDHLGAI